MKDEVILKTDATVLIKRTSRREEGLGKDEISVCEVGRA